MVNNFRSSMNRGEQIIHVIHVWWVFEAQSLCCLHLFVILCWLISCSWLHLIWSTCYLIVICHAFAQDISPRFVLFLRFTLFFSLQFFWRLKGKDERWCLVSSSLINDIFYLFLQQWLMPLVWQNTMCKIFFFIQGTLIYREETWVEKCTWWQKVTKQKASWCTIGNFGGMCKAIKKSVMAWC